MGLDIERIEITEVQEFFDGSFKGARSDGCERVGFILSFMRLSLFFSLSLQKSDSSRKKDRISRFIVRFFVTVIDVVRFTESTIFRFYANNHLKNVLLPTKNFYTVYTKQINIKPQNYENSFTFISSVFLFFAGSIYANTQQEKRVTGTVTSEREPLPGVSVQLKGASSGTITDIDGNYLLKLPSTVR